MSSEAVTMVVLVAGIVAILALGLWLTSSRDDDDWPPVKRDDGVPKFPDAFDPEVFDHLPPSEDEAVREIQRERRERERRKDHGE